MNIVFVSLHSPLSYLGGAEILTLVLAESLVHLGHQVTIYTAGRGKRRVIQGVTVQETPFFRFPLRFRTVLMPLYSLILRPFFYFNKDFRHADIVHAVDSSGIMLLSGWGFLRKKFVVTIQDYTLIWPAKDYFSYGRTVLNKHSLIRNFVKKVRNIISHAAIARIPYAICVSNYVAQKYKAVNTTTKIAVVGNCVSPSWTRNKRVNKRDIDLLYVGKLMPYKGLDVLLDSLTYLPKRRKVNVVIIGEGMTKRYMQHIVRDGITHHVRFTGPIPHRDIPQFYLRSKIVVSPSLWPEPCGRSIIEAMWMGCAVVATNVGGTPESLIDKSHGYLVPPHDPRAIASAVYYLLAHTQVRHRFGQQAALHAEANYSARRIAKEYLRFYDLIKSQ